MNLTSDEKSFFGIIDGFDKYNDYFKVDLSDKNTQLSSSILNNPQLMEDYIFKKKRIKLLLVVILRRENYMNEVSTFQPIQKTKEIFI